MDFDTSSNNSNDSSSESSTYGCNPYPHFNLHLGSKGIRFGTWNVNRLTTSKMEQIKLFLLGNDNRPQVDILSINETFLKPNLPDCLFSVPGFTIYRRDRKGTRKGGGILVYVNDEIKHRRRTDIENSNIEAVWLEVFPFKSNRPVLFSGIYRPPSYSKEDDQVLENMFETVYLLNLETIFVGDMNMNYLSTSFKKHPLGRALSSLNFNQLVSEVTRPVSGTCIDHVFANRPERIHSILVKNNGLSDHLPVFGVRLYKAKFCDRPRKMPCKITYRNMKHFKESSFLSSLKEIPWSTLCRISCTSQCRGTKSAEKGMYPSKSKKENILYLLEEHLTLNLSLHFSSFLQRI